MNTRLIKTLYQELTQPITTTNRTTKPDTNQPRRKDLTPSDKILELAYKLRFFFFFAQKLFASCSKRFSFRSVAFRAEILKTTKQPFCAVLILRTIGPFVG